MPYDLHNPMAVVGSHGCTAVAEVVVDTFAEAWRGWLINDLFFFSICAMSNCFWLRSSIANAINSRWFLSVVARLLSYLNRIVSYFSSLFHSFHLHASWTALTFVPKLNKETQYTHVSNQVHHSLWRIYSSLSWEYFMGHLEVPHIRPKFQGKISGNIPRMVFLACFQDNGHSPEARQRDILNLAEELEYDFETCLFAELTLSPLASSGVVWDLAVRNPNWCSKGKIGKTWKKHAYFFAGLALRSAIFHGKHAGN